MEIQILLGILSYAVFLSTPYLLASIGEVWSERAGILNIGIEGYMYFGAFIAYYVTFLTNNYFLGALTSIIAGIMLSLLNAVLSIDVKVPQIIIGISINIFAIGLSNSWYRLIFGESPPNPVGKFEYIKVPILEKIPVIGSILFNQPLPVYISLSLAILCQYLLYRTGWGLSVRACGESPLAVESVGVNVRRTMYFSNLVCGALSGFSGAFLSLCYLSYFIQGITAGKGFIVLAIVIAGGWDFIKCMLVALVYGFIESLQLSLQIAGVKVSYPFLMMLPYLVTIIILIIKREAMPQALGIPYSKEK